MAPGEGSKIFINGDQSQWEQVAEGVRRKVIAYDHQLMVVKVSFEAGGIGSLHHHHHSQITHVESGLFEIEIGGEKMCLRGGDSYYVPPNAPHAAVCLDAGVLIDSFSPMREEFIKSS